MKQRRDEGARFLGGWPKVLATFATNLLVVGIPFVMLAPLACGQQEAGVYPDRERAFVAGLQSRRLFEIAETVCVRLLDDTRATPGDQIALAIDLVKIRTASARNASWDQRAAAWDRVHEIGDQFASEFPEHPSAILLRVQLAISHRQRAAFLDQELGARMVPASQLPATRQRRLSEARTARRAFEESLREIADLMSRQRTGSPLRSGSPSDRRSDGVLSSERLLSLRSGVNYQLALSRMLIADSYSDSDGQQLSRISELREVQRDLETVQRGIDPNEPLWWQAEISRLQCLRKLRQFGESRQAIASLPKFGVPDDLVAPLLEERLWLAIESEDVDAMKAALSADFIEDDAGRTPALDIARLRAAIALSRLTPPDQRATWTEAANAIQRRIDQIDGAYWGRMARLALVSEAEESSAIDNAPGKGSSNASVELLVRTARTSLAAGEVGDALAAFDAAIEQLAGSPEDPSAQNRSFALTIEASKILEGQRRSRLAADRLMEVAMRFPQSPSAAAVHLRGVWNLAQAMRNKPEENEDQKSPVDELSVALQQHLDTFGDSPTIDQAALWLASQHLARNQFEPAARSLMRLTTGGPLLTKSVGRFSDVIFAMDDAENVDRNSVRKTAGLLVEDLQRRIAAMTASGQLIPAEVVDAAIQIVLAANLVPAESVASWMRQDVMVQSVDSQAVLDRSAWFCLAELLGELLGEVQGGEEALLVRFSELMNSQTSVGHSRMLAVLGRLTQAATNVIAKKRFERVSLVVVNSAIDSIGGDRSADDLKAMTQWRFQQAKLLRQSGETAAAIRILEELRAGGSRDQAVELEFARSLSQAQEESDAPATNALTTWRKLAASLKPRSEAWYESKWMVARELVRAGDAPAAAKMLRYLKSVHGWGDSEFADRLERLLNSL